jgi:hypothetical protein
VTFVPLRDRKQMSDETEASIRKKGVNAFPSDGFSLVVDGKLKTHYGSGELALKQASELKSRFPALQIMVRDNTTTVRTEIETGSAVPE